MSPSRVAEESGGEIAIEGRRFALSNLDKVLWRKAGFTKGAMIDYYARAAGALLPHLAGRPVALRRFPDGVEERGWYQFQWPRAHPSWLRAYPVAGRSRDVWHFCAVDDLASLLWAANLAAVELHPYLRYGERPEEPTALVFDLDPGPPADLAGCARVALRLRGVLAELGLVSLAKTSGSIGLHVVVPLNTPHNFAETRSFARSLARRLAARLPGLVVAEAGRSARAGKVLLDWGPNHATRSLVAPYSLRAAGWPTVSTPVAWEEVEQAAAEGKAELLTFEPAAVLERLDRVGDLFRPVLELEQRLPRQHH